MTPVRLSIYLLALLLLAGCHKTFPVTEVEPAFDICEPLRGLDQDDGVWSKGHAMNSLPHGCL